MQENDPPPPPPPPHTHTQPNAGKKRLPLTTPGKLCAQLHTRQLYFPLVISSNQWTVGPPPSGIEMKYKRTYYTVILRMPPPPLPHPRPRGSHLCSPGTNATTSGIHMKVLRMNFVNKVEK